MIYEIAGVILGGVFVAFVIWRLIQLDLRINAILNLIDRLSEPKSEIDAVPFECPRCKQPTPIPGVLCPRCRERL